MTEKEYAVYKGDELLVIGTLKECAEKLNVTESTIFYYQFESYQKRAKNPKNRRITILL